MTKKMIVIFTVLAVFACFSLPSFAAETVKGKVTALDKDAKKIQIEGKDYTMSDEAVSTEVSVGDEVEATVDDDVVKTLTKS
jgi:hypothetical protein